MKPMRTRVCLIAAAALLTAAFGVGGAIAADKPAPGPVAQPAAAPPAPAAAAAPAAKPAGPIPAEDITGVDFSGLNEEQKKLVVDLLNTYKCPCPCGMKLAQCRRDMKTCAESLGIANQAVSMAKQGKSRDEIVKAALTPASQYIQFDIPPGDAPSVGPKDAKVTILHYFDYQCPFCAKIAPALDQLVTDYPKDVRIYFKMHALDIHPNAMIAAQGALAAQAQGKFLEMHKKLLANQQQLSRDNILGWAKELGLNIEKFTKDLDSEAIKARIQKEGAEAQNLGATGTPASFLNGRYVSGAKPYPFWKDMVDEELKWAKDGTRPKFTIGKNVSETQPKSQAASGPDPNKAYTIPLGDAPVIGPPKATVLIQHYLDYQ